MTRFPSVSLLSKRTLFGWDSSTNSVGGAMLTASARKERRLFPKRRSASSAASSARSISFNLLLASAWNLLRIVPASLTISAVRDSGRAGCSLASPPAVAPAVAPVVVAALLSSFSGMSFSVVVVVLSAFSGLVREIARARLMRSPKPLVACSLATVLIFWASSM